MHTPSPNMSDGATTNSLQQAPRLREFTSYILSLDNYSDYGDYQLHHPNDFLPPPTGPLLTFHEWFLEVHGYASVVVCVFGIFTNIFNITVLMARDMRTATNYLLTFLAVADILTMLLYIPFTIHFYCPTSDPYASPWKYSYGWIVYMLIVIHLVATTHTISIWLAVTLAAFRFNQIRSPCPSGPLAREKRIRQVKLATLLIYLLSICALIPTYIHNEIEPVVVGGNFSAYGLKETKVGSPEADLFVFTNVLTYAVLAKIIPCILILVFSGSLLYHMAVKTARRRQRLSANRQHASTTRMLLVVLILFVVTELPQGILLILVATVPGFYHKVSYPIGELVDFVSLLNNAVNFILYCVMSQQFREKFCTIYIKPLCERRRTIITSTSELLILREHVPRTITTTTHEEGNNAKV